MTIRTFSQATRLITICLIAMLALGATAALATNGPLQAANQSRVQASFDAWAAGTGSPYDLLADKAIWTITGNSLASKTYPSRQAFIGGVIKPFNARMSVGLKPKVRNMYASGDTVVVFFDASGVAKDGKAYSNTYAWFLKMNDGKIVQAHAFFDSIAFNDLWTRVPATPVEQ